MISNSSMLTTLYCVVRIAETGDTYYCSGDSRVTSVRLDGEDGFTKAPYGFPNLTITTENDGQSFVKVSVFYITLEYTNSAPQRHDVNPVFVGYSQLSDSASPKPFCGFPKEVNRRGYAAT